MAIFRTSTSIAANSVNTNLLNGSKFEFLARPAAVTVYASQETAIGDITIDFTLGNVVVGEDLPPNVAAVVGNINRREDGIGSGVGDAGDRIQIRAANSNAAPKIVNLLVDISELA